MGKKLHLIGKKFNYLEVISETNQRTVDGCIVWQCWCHKCEHMVYKSTKALTRYPLDCGCSNRADITNMRSGKLVAIHPTTKKKNNNIYWDYQCDCGNKKMVLAKYIISQEVKSCGCLSSGRSAELEGRWFGRLFVQEKLEERTLKGRVLWRCQCRCGNMVNVTSTSLISIKGTKSCGCLKDEVFRSAPAIINGTCPYKFINPKPTVKNKTGFLGVSLKSDGTYLATMTFQKQLVLSQSFNCIEDAAEARRRCEKKYYTPLLKETGLLKE
ncbi:MAG: hypothetical protein ACRDBO_03975 [Lachnospiraceae bacterium]